MRGFQLALTIVVIAVFAQPLLPSCQEGSTKAAPEKVYRVVGGDVKAPRPIHSPDPEYTEKARKEGKEGTVLIKMVVGSNGLPHDIKVIRPLDPDLDELAVDTVKTWKFAPGTKDGEPVAV
jgi:periplasmic protein TonB